MADRAGVPAPAVVARVSPEPVVRVHAGRRRTDGAAAPRIPDPLRRAVAGHRTHGRLPRLHLGRPPVPGRRRYGRHAHRARVSSGHDRGSRRQVRARVLGVRSSPRARRALPDPGWRSLRGAGMAGQHRVSGLRHRGGPDLVGSAQRRSRSFRGGRDLERHERARHRGHPPRRDALRPRPPAARALSQPVRAANGDGDQGRAARLPAPSPTLRAHSRRMCRDPAVRGQLDGGQPLALGSPLDEHADGDGLRRLGAAVRRRRHRGFRGSRERGAVRALDAVRHAFPVLPQPLGDRERRPVRLVLGDAVEDLVRDAIRLRYRLLP